MNCLLADLSHEISKIVSEYDQEIPQSQTATTPWHNKEEPLRPCLVSYGSEKIKNVVCCKSLKALYLFNVQKQNIFKMGY